MRVRIFLTAIVAVEFLLASTLATAREPISESHNDTQQGWEAVGNADALSIETDAAIRQEAKAGIDNVYVPERSIDFSLPDTVRLDRVRYCRSKVFCRGQTSYEDYEYWEHNNVAKEKQKRTWLAKLSEPAPSDVEHLVFIAAGQQTSGTLVEGAQLSSAITGQDSNYKNDFRANSRDKSKIVNINSNYAEDILTEGNWNPEKTFIGLAFDARFHQNFSSGNKQEIENA